MLGYTFRRLVIPLRRLPVLGLFVLMACDAPDAGLLPRHANAVGPSIVPLDSLALSDEVEPYIRQPIGLAVDPVDGTYYVADVIGGYVFRYSRTGERLQRYGGRGSELSETTGLQGVAIFDTMVALIDDGAHLIKLYAKGASAFQKALTYAGYASLHVRSAKDTFVVGVNDTTSGKAVLIWNTLDAPPSAVVPLPKEYRLYPRIGLFNSVPVIRWADTLLVGFGPLDHLVIADITGSLIDSISIPVARRRGAPREVLFASDATIESVMNGVSALVSSHRLADGKLILLHYDNSMRWETRSDIRATLFVSIVNAARESVCLDGRVPLEADTQPYTSFRGDTLFVIAKHVRTDARSYVFRYLIDSGACKWIPIREAN